MLTKLRARAHEAAEIFRRITPASEAAVKRTSLGNYVEHVAAGADGVPFLDPVLAEHSPERPTPGVRSP